MKILFNRGFTLIELIVVIVLLGIMAAGAGLLISRPIEAYNDQLRRQQLVDSAEMALRQIAIDIRRALPNSIRLAPIANPWALEMVNTVDGARYRDEAGGGFAAANDILDFTSTDTDFNVLGQFSTLSTGALPANNRIVIYNTNSATIYADASASNNPGIISNTGLSLSNNGIEHHLAMNTAFQFAFQSPTQRLFVVDGPISYICANGSLTRFDGYSYQAAQLTTVAGLSALPGVNTGVVATQVTGCTIIYDQGTPSRGGLITLSLTLTDGAGESVTLLHQVHVDNTP